ncbi:MAG: hypothetical protein ACMXYG_01595 [Candidatus Woesearchaeota archaeon]
MYKKIILTIQSFLIVVFLIACSTSSPSIDYRTGRQGLELSITGPNNIIIYTGSELPLETYDIKIENKGATDIKNDEFFMRVTPTGNFLRPTENTVLIVNSLNEITGGRITEIAGKSLYSSKGDEIYHSVIFRPFPQDIFQTTLNVDVCYTYKTILSDSICIETIRNQENGCKTNRYNYNRGQGAPIVIESVELKYLPSTENRVKPRLEIDIVNADGGIVTLPENFKEGCLAQNQINQVKIDSVKLGEQELLCDVPENILQLDQRRKIICNLESELEEDPQGYYDTLLYIELSYGFHATRNMRVSITRQN